MTIAKTTQHTHRGICQNCGKPDGAPGDCLLPTAHAIYLHTFVKPTCERCAEAVTVVITRQEARALAGYISRAFYMDFNWPADAKRLQQQFEDLGE